MKMKPLVSIIVPVYNTQEYLSRCIDSLINQTYSGLEIILVNDGSTDNSREICDAYAKRDYRIKVIHQRNKGAAEAKNTGLNFCTGEYISFVDSDDFIKETYIEKLLKLSIKYQADLVQCMYQTGSNNYFKSIDKQKSKILVLDGNRIFQSKFYKSIVWGKLYKKNLFKNIRFIPNRHIDDEGVSYKNYYLANRTVITTEQLYYYYQSPNSLMRNNRKISLDFMDTFEERLNYFKDRDERKLWELSMERYCIILMLKYMRVYNNPFNSNDDAQRIIDRFNEIFPYVAKSKYSNLKNIVILRFFKLFPHLSSEVMNIAKRR